jgi:hypothetical protein
MNTLMHGQLEYVIPICKRIYLTYRKDRTREFQRVARQWNFLLASRNTLLTEASTNLLVPLCPACPQPGLNMDDKSIAKMPPDKR